MSFNPKKTFVVGPSWVGDMVMAQSLFKVIKQRFPETLIDVLAPGWTLPLLARMPEVRRGVAMPIGHGRLALGERVAIGRRLREEAYDWAIVLPNSLKAALIPFFARITRRTGYVGELRWGWLNDARPLDKQRLPMTVQRFVALGLPRETASPEILPRPGLTIESHAVDNALQSLGLMRASSPLLVLCPGAEYGPAKRWPAAYFAAVAKAKLAAGWRVWVLGSAKDQEIGEEIASSAGQGCVNLAGKTQLADAVDLMSLADVVVTNDSGLMHVAAALDRPTLAVYGSSDPGFTPPLSDKARVLRTGIDCSPCFKRECPLGHTRCLTELLPETVLAAFPKM